MSDATTPSLDAILNHLEHLIQADSSDPESMITPAHPALVYVTQVLQRAGCEVRITDLGSGCINLYASRGHPRVLFNCHLDTVKPNPAWTKDPFKLRIDDARAYGLGACDIKGAAACLLHVAESNDEPIAILFSTDEEAGKGVCVNAFLEKQSNAWECVVVAEPTKSACVLQHRGFASFEVHFRGHSGHTSGADASDQSAVHQAIQWGEQALTLTQPGGVLHDARFNIGIVQGGTGSNVIASDTTVRFGFRPKPHTTTAEMTQVQIQSLKHILPKHGQPSWKNRFIGPALTRTGELEEAVRSWGIKFGPDVDFWTEAALFAAGGVPALVLGPGDIAQAHTADEYVETDQLIKCANAYLQIVHAEGSKLLAQGGACAT